MKYMLDTDICIYLKNRRHPQVVTRFSHFQKGEVVISLVTFGELLNGAMKSNQADTALLKINQLANILAVQPMPADCARHYALIRSRLEKQGNIIGANDLWIAAHAMSLNLTLVSNNIREFSCIEGLRLENWVEKQ